MQSDASVKSSHLIDKIWNTLVLTVIMISKLMKFAIFYAMLLWVAYNTVFFEKLHMGYSIIALNFKSPCVINIECYFVRLKAVM